jgi:hypothetical protein
MCARPAGSAVIGGAEQLEGGADGGGLGEGPAALVDRAGGQRVQQGQGEVAGAAGQGRAGRAGVQAGVIVLGATQRPSGIGTGPVAQQFTAFRDNFQVRFALRTGSWQVSDLVLGSCSEGFDSSMLLPAYKGVGILRGAADATPTVRTYLADQEDAERILTAARAFRERAGTLTGVVKVWSHVGRQGIQWPTLAENMPEGYAGASGESISALLRAEGIASIDVKASGVVLKGCKLADVETARQRRQLTAR